MTRRLRLLLLADTHLGFDLPRRPRVKRRRRGEDFFASYHRALEPARRGEVDLVVHGGDLLFRSRVPASLVQRALAPLKEIADGGVPVVLVLGNHERSRLPFPLLGLHPGLHLIDHPRTVRIEQGGLRVALSGFPFERQAIASRFPSLVARTGWAEVDADIRLLCLHQTVEGARVGPVGYQFRRGDDVVPGRLLPPDFAAVLAGHIHRHQILRRDLARRPLPSPVLYPGSTERTSFAEMEETKGYVTAEVAADGSGTGRLIGARFHPLPTRPMASVDLPLDDLDRRQLRRRLEACLAAQDDDAIVRLRLQGRASAEVVPLLRADALRRLAPSSMTLEVVWRRFAEAEEIGEGRDTMASAARSEEEVEHVAAPAPDLSGGS